MALSQALDPIMDLFTAGFDSISLVCGLFAVVLCTFIASTDSPLPRSISQLLEACCQIQVITWEEHLRYAKR